MNKKKSKPKAEYLEVRLNSDQKDAFKTAAGYSGVPLSAWVRERLRWAATKELQEAGRVVPFLRIDGE